MCFVCLLERQRTTFKWKGIISVFSVLQGSAETLVRWKNIPSSDCLFSIKHLCQKLLKSNNACSSYSEKCPGSFFTETQCSSRASIHKSDIIVYNIWTKSITVASSQLHVQALFYHQQFSMLADIISYAASVTTDRWWHFRRLTRPHNAVAWPTVADKEDGSSKHQTTDSTWPALKHEAEEI